MALSKGFSAPAALRTGVQGHVERLSTLLFVDDEREIAASLADLFRRIDQALYRAKENGRNCVELDNVNEMETRRD